MPERVRTVLIEYDRKESQWTLDEGEVDLSGSSRDFFGVARGFYVAKSAS